MKIDEMKRKTHWSRTTLIIVIQMNWSTDFFVRNVEMEKVLLLSQNFLQISLFNLVFIGEREIDRSSRIEISSMDSNQRSWIETTNAFSKFWKWNSIRNQFERSWSTIGWISSIDVIRIDVLSIGSRESSLFSFGSGWSYSTSFHSKTLSSIIFNHCWNWSIGLSFSERIFLFSWWSSDGNLSWRCSTSFKKSFQRTFLSNCFRWSLQFIGWDSKKSSSRRIFNPFKIFNGDESINDHIQFSFH